MSEMPSLSEISQQLVSKISKEIFNQLEKCIEEVEEFDEFDLRTGTSPYMNWEKYNDLKRKCISNKIEVILWSGKK